MLTGIEQNGHPAGRGNPLIQMEAVGLILGQQAKTRPKGWFGRGATVALPGYQVFQDLSGKIYPGDRWAVLGTVGSGKTSFLRLLNRLIEPTQGRLFWQGQPYDRIPIATLRQQIVWVAQEPKLLGMTVQQALEYPLRLRNLAPNEIENHVKACLAQMAIPSAWLTKTEPQLSAGQRQWIAIARGMIAQPAVLLLDEPTAYLDMGFMQQLTECLLEQQNLSAVITATHDVPWIQSFCSSALYVADRRGQWFTDQPDWANLQVQLTQARQQLATEWNEPL
ncbi:ABC transporter ATP-binding protein [Alkalinema pantanalense CENA528]|uniref:ABC transporter ATP-binding protein n=1 Tax=Alkalinema pantanalense TaxID=1620705 RepID=UPI003D6EC656